ncbi:MAG: hypothetical protein H6625_11185 [Bdellovibrionaceae bacterium]|nr:hypothetical protein [Pseudobdellovibrionaceae bacterium]
MRWLVFIFFGYGAVTLGATKKATELRHWTEYGKRLFGESWTVQKSSIESLKLYPHLRAELIQAIQSNQNRELAADIIASLKLYSMMDILVKYSKEDQTGHLYLAMNSLITKNSRESLIGLYALRLKNSDASLPARIIMMDTLGRMKYKLEIALIENWLSNGNFEIQSSTLNYLRRLKGQFSNKEFKSLASIALASPWYQIRLQVLYSLPYYFIDFSSCEKDKNKYVRKLCLEKKNSKEINW